MVLNAVANDSSVEIKEPLDFNTSSLYEIMPMFQDKLGPNKSLEMFMSYRDMAVHFGRYHDYGSDVALEFTGRLQVRVLKGENMHLKDTEVFYDEFRMRAQLDIQIENDVLFAKITELRFNVDKRYGQKTVPIRNKMDLSRNDYFELISQFKNSLNFARDFLNMKVLPQGVQFPYYVNEFYTTLQFDSGAMYFIFEVEENAGDYLEETVDEIENYFDY